MTTPALALIGIFIKIDFMWQLWPSALLPSNGSVIYAFIFEGCFMTTLYSPGKAPGASGTTAASQVFDALKRDLIRGRFTAGEKLAINALKSQYQVGLSPLREALNRLAAYGLLEQLNQRGFRVPILDASELADIAYLRAQLEGMALTQALRKASVEWESQLLAAQHCLRRADHTPCNIEQWEQAHQRFHRTLLAPCGSPWLLQFIEQLHDQFDRYRRLAPANPAIREELDCQHDKLVALVLEHRASEACDLLEAHICLSHQAAEGACGKKGQSSPSR